MRKEAVKKKQYIKDFLRVTARKDRGQTWGNSVIFDNIVYQ